MLNKLIKFFSFCGVYLLTFASMYLLSFVFTAPLVTTTMLVMSIVASIPANILTDFWWIYLICCCPLAVVFDIIVDFNLAKYMKKL
jgi:hypothetical protein